MTSSRALIVVLAATLVGCAAGRANQPYAGGRARRAPQVDEKIEPWRTEEGRKATWRDMARWYIDNGMPGEALKMVTRLRKSGEVTPDLQVIQARALAAQEVPEEARSILEGLIEERPRYAEAYKALGVVLADLGDVDAAIATLRRALQLSPTDTATRNNLGFLLFAAGDCTQASTELEQVVGEDATLAKYRNNLAYALACTGEYERALSLFRSTGPEAHARYQMGVAMERLDKIPGAVLQYEAALVADPEHEPATEALARLGGRTTPSSGDAE